MHVNHGVSIAGKVRAGDKILTLCGWQRVASVERVKGLGLFNPQTMDGNIVVDGVVVSTFTQSLDALTAHGLLSPLRALFRGGMFISTILSQRAMGTVVLSTYTQMWKTLSSSLSLV